MIQDKYSDHEIFPYAESGDILKLKEYLDSECNLYQSDEDGLTLLHWAAWRGHDEAVKLLLNHGFEVDYRDYSD